MAITKYTDVDGFGIPYNKDGNWGGGSGGGVTYTLDEGYSGTEPVIKLVGDNGSLTVARFDANDFKIDTGKITAKDYAVQTMDSSLTDNGRIVFTKDNTILKEIDFDCNNFKVETDATGITTIALQGGSSSSKRYEWLVEQNTDGTFFGLWEIDGTTYTKVGNELTFDPKYFTVYLEGGTDIVHVASAVTLKATATGANNGEIFLADGDGYSVGNLIEVDKDSMELKQVSGTWTLSAKGGSTSDVKGLYAKDQSSMGADAPIGVIDSNGDFIGKMCMLDNDSFKVDNTDPVQPTISTKGGKADNLFLWPSTSYGDGTVELRTKDNVRISGFKVDHNTMDFTQDAWGDFKLSAKGPEGLQPQAMIVDTANDGSKSIYTSILDESGVPTFDATGDVLVLDKDSFDVQLESGTDNTYRLISKGGGGATGNVHGIQFWASTMKSSGGAGYTIFINGITTDDVPDVPPYDSETTWQYMLTHGSKIKWLGGYVHMLYPSGTETRTYIGNVGQFYADGASQYKFNVNSSGFDSSNAGLTTYCGVKVLDLDPSKWTSCNVRLNFQNL